MESEYYIATTDEKGYVIYDSDMYKLSEIDIINLIKVCLVERRNQKIGKKILDAYTDSTKHKKDIVQQKLTLIGLKIDDGKPTTTKKATSK